MNLIAPKHNDLKYFSAIPLLLICCCIGLTQLNAQSYHALNGNVYGSGLSVYNNPASIVHQPFRWDITPLAIQQKSYTNIFSIREYSLLSKPDSSYIKMTPGYYGRIAHFQSDIRLFNLRFNIGRNRAIAMGANIRNYLHAKSSAYNFLDTLKSTPEFFNLNEMISLPMEASAIHASWGELYGSYAQTLFENEVLRLSGGVTLKLQRGLSAGFVRVNNGYFEKRGDLLDPTFVLTNGKGNYGYSSNYDWIKDGKTGNQNIKDFLGHTLNSGSADLGAELLIRYTGLVNDREAPVYNWKIGISILDIGSNRYKHGIQGRMFNGFKTEPTDTMLQQKFETVATVSEFNDSLNTIAAGVRQQSGFFNVSQPTRLVINADKHLSEHFYLNAGLSLNLGSAFKSEKFRAREMDLLTITPRWEKKRFGAYLPIQYTAEGQFWVGMAVKAGPVLLGLHNANWIFSKKAMPNGGFYLAFTFRNWKVKDEDGIYGCPPPL